MVISHNQQSIYPFIIVNVPCLIAATLSLHTEHRILFGNMNRCGHSHRQTWFCDRFHRWVHHSSVPLLAVLHHPSSLPDLYTSQTAGAISCRWQKDKISHFVQRKLNGIYLFLQLASYLPSCFQEVRVFHNAPIRCQHNSTRTAHMLLPIKKMTRIPSGL